MMAFQFELTCNLRIELKGATTRSILVLSDQADLPFPCPRVHLLFCSGPGFNIIALFN
jgi:hypothetical protein